MCKIKNILPALLLLFFTFSLPAKADVNQDLINKASFGRAADVELLLKQHADPNATNAAGISALFLATNRSDDEAPKIVAALIRGGVDIYRTDLSGDLPIIVAVKRGHPLTVRVLIDNKAILSVTDNNGKGLLELAQMRGNNEILQYVQAGLTAEKSKLADLQSNDNFTKLVKKLSMLSCTEYYLVYFKKENPDKLGDEKYASLMKKNKDDTEFTITQLTSLFDMGKAEIRNITTKSKQQVQDKLHSLMTKENRLYNGFGTNTHLNRTCLDITNRLNTKGSAQK